MLLEMTLPMRSKMPMRDKVPLWARDCNPLDDARASYGVSISASSRNLTAFGSSSKAFMNASRERSGCPVRS